MARVVDLLCKRGKHKWEPFGALNKKCVRCGIVEWK